MDDLDQGTKFDKPEGASNDTKTHDDDEEKLEAERNLEAVDDEARIDC